MNYIEFRNRFQGHPLILSKEVVRLEKDRQNIRNQLNRWLDKGLIIKLKKGIYILNKNDRKIQPGEAFIANELYAPSYVSLEYALNLYGLIPEKVTWVTSVTTKKTARFSNELGEYVYQHVKPGAFRGFQSIKDKDGFSAFIAEPEKAVVDFLYLNLKRFTPGDKDVFEQSFRFQNVGSLRRNRCMMLSKLFNNRKLLKVTRTFCEFIKERA